MYHRARHYVAAKVLAYPTLLYRTLLILALLAGGVLAKAQLLQGTVVDAQGSPIAFANLYLEELGSGAATDIDGQFSLRLERGGDYRIVLTAIGYQPLSDTVIVKASGVTTLQLSLKQDIALLDEVVVRAAKRDSGYIIMREVARRRSEYLREAGPYRAEVYVKAREDIATRIKRGKRDRTSLDDLALPGEDGALPGLNPADENADSLETDINLLELRMRLNVSPPKGYKEERLAQSVYGSGDGLFVPVFGEGDINFYRARVDFGGLTKTPIISPLSPVGVINYKFKLIETRRAEDGSKVHEVEFKPRKRGGNATAQGVLLINADLYNLREVEATLPRGALLVFDELSVHQRYELVEGTTWLPVQQSFAYETRLGQRQRFRGNTDLAFSDFELDYPFPPKFFNGEVAAVDPLAYKRDSTYWKAARPVPLAAEEIEKVRTADSISARLNSVEYKDSLEAEYNKITPLEILWEGVGWRDHRRREQIGIGSLPGLISFNIVGGWRIRPYVSYFRRYESEQSLNVFAQASYGLQRKDVLGSVFANYRYDPKRLADYALSFGRDFESIFPGDGIRNQLSRSNYILADRVAAAHSLEILNGLYLFTWGEYTDRRAAPIENSATFLSDWIDDEEPIQFEPYQAFITETELKFTPYQRYLSEPLRKVVLGSNWPTFSLTHRRGWEGPLSSDIRFDFLEAAVEQRLELGALGNLRYRAQGGQFINTDDLRIVDLKRIRRSDPLLFFEPLIGFQGLDTSLATTRPFLELHVIHHFNGALVNNLPLVRLLRIEAVAGGGVLWLQEGAGFQHQEAFAGLERIFKLGARRRLRLGVYGLVSKSSDRGVVWEPKISFDVIDTWKRNWSF